MLQSIKSRLKDQRGLTLIELLAVIVILGIIAAIAIPSIGNIIDNSKEKAVKADAKLILNAAKLYIADNGVPAKDATTNKSTIDQGELAPEYIDGVTTFTAYEIDVTSGSEIGFISGTGTKDPITIDFSGKTLTTIDTATPTP